MIEGHNPFATAPTLVGPYVPPKEEILPKEEVERRAQVAIDAGKRAVGLEDMTTDTLVAWERDAVEAEQ